MNPDLHWNYKQDFFFFLGMERACLIFSMDLASGLVTCLSANSPFPYQSGALKKNKLKIAQVLQ